MEAWVRRHSRVPGTWNQIRLLKAIICWLNGDGKLSLICDENTCIIGRVKLLSWSEWRVSCPKHVCLLVWWQCKKIALTQLRTSSSSSCQIGFSEVEVKMLFKMSPSLPLTVYLHMLIYFQWAFQLGGIIWQCFYRKHHRHYHNNMICSTVK